MIGAVDDILSHVRRLGPAARMLLVGLIAFVVAAFTYGSRGADVGAVQWVLYGMVGFIPSVISSWLVHRYIDDPQPVTAAG
jgi:membrane protein implicated in regulation of membrane protease activity